MKDIWIFAIGGIAQLMFSARTVIQWIMTERARKVISPAIFWQLSLLASLMLMIYGILRDDLVIILGQLVSYYIYIRNLQFKNVWSSLHGAFRWVAYLFPFIVFLWMFSGPTHNWHDILHNEDVSLSLLTLGTIGQVIFATRFIFQWYHSEKQKESVFPPAFWIISISGSLLILLYGIFRRDPVLILGQAFGQIVYIRNLYVHYTQAPYEAVKHDP